jgi:hypothetical protein
LCRLGELYCSSGSVSASRVRNEDNMSGVLIVVDEVEILKPRVGRKYEQTQSTAELQLIGHARQQYC